MDAWISDLTAHRRQFARQFAKRKRQRLPAENSADLDAAFPGWTVEDAGLVRAEPCAAASACSRACRSRSAATRWSIAWRTALNALWGVMRHFRGNIPG